MNITEILENADTQKIADAIGIPTKIKGKYTYILCPGHEKHVGHADNTFGSCVLTEYGYYCFASKTGTNIINMVIEQSELDGNPLNFHEALQFICRVMNFELESNQERTLKPLPLKTEELKLIGYHKSELKRKESIYAYLPEKVNDKTVLLPQYVTTVDTQQLATLRDCYNSNPKLFWEIISENISAQIKKTAIVFNLIRDNPLILTQNGFTNTQDPINLIETLQTYYFQLTELQNKINLMKVREK